MRVWLDRKKLEAYNLDPLDVMQALRLEHMERPAGYLQSERIELNVRTMGEMRTVKEFEAIPILSRPNQLIYLRDVAVIEDDSKTDEASLGSNGQPTVGVGVMRAMGSNVVEVCNAVKSKMADLRKLAPPGMEISISTDFSLFDN